MTAPAYGISNSSDILVSRLRDGVDLNEVWTDMVAALAEFNREGLSIVSLLSYETPNSADAVFQNLTVPSFEESTEHGVPKSIPTPAEVLLCGFTRKDYDLRTEFTWKLLREADRRQVDGIVNTAFAADNRLMTGTILRRLFNPAEHTTSMDTEFSSSGMAPMVWPRRIILGRPSRRRPRITFPVRMPFWIRLIWKTPPE
jgi:hypothetical protein